MAEYSKSDDTREPGILTDATADSLSTTYSVSLEPIDAWVERQVASVQKCVHDQRQTGQDSISFGKGCNIHDRHNDSEVPPLQDNPPHGQGGIADVDSTRWVAQRMHTVERSALSVTQSHTGDTSTHVRYRRRMENTNHVHWEVGNSDQNDLSRSGEGSASIGENVIHPTRERAPDDWEGIQQGQSSLSSSLNDNLLPTTRRCLDGEHQDQQTTVNAFHLGERGALDYVHQEGRSLSYKPNISLPEHRQADDLDSVHQDQEMVSRELNDNVLQNRRSYDPGQQKAAGILNNNQFENWRRVSIDFNHQGQSAPSHRHNDSNQQDRRCSEEMDSKTLRKRPKTRDQEQQTTANEQGDSHRRIEAMGSIYQEERIPSYRQNYRIQQVRRSPEEMDSRTLHNRPKTEDKEQQTIASELHDRDMEQQERTGHLNSTQLEQRKPLHTPTSSLLQNRGMDAYPQQRSVSCGPNESVPQNRGGTEHTNTVYQQQSLPSYRPAKMDLISGGIRSLFPAQVINDHFLQNRRIKDQKLQNTANRVDDNQFEHRRMEGVDSSLQELRTFSQAQNESIHQHRSPDEMDSRIVQNKPRMEEQQTTANELDDGYFQIQQRTDSIHQEQNTSSHSTKDSTNQSRNSRYRDSSTFQNIQRTKDEEDQLMTDRPNESHFERWRRITEGLDFIDQEPNLPKLRRNENFHQNIPEDSDSELLQKRGAIECQEQLTTNRPEDIPAQNVRREGLDSIHQEQETTSDKSDASPLQSRRTEDLTARKVHLQTPLCDTNENSLQNRGVAEYLGLTTEERITTSQMFNTHHLHQNRPRGSLKDSFSPETEALGSDQDDDSIVILQSENMSCTHDLVSDPRDRQIAVNQDVIQGDVRPRVDGNDGPRSISNRGNPSHIENESSLARDGMGAEDLDSIHLEIGRVTRGSPTEEPSGQSTVEDSRPDNINSNPTQIDFLKYLELEEFYPEKITLQNVMLIGQSEPASKTQSGKVPWTILQNLIMLDQRCITKEVFSIYSETPDDNSNAARGSREESDFASMSSLSDSEDQIHPADIFMAIFACCDLNLRQILIQKMYQCRLALPFLFPDVQTGQLTYNLWALRTTTLIWRDTSDRAVETSVVDHHIHTVACVRLGRPRFSKSQLLNNVISDFSQETFLNKDSPNGDSQRRFTDGLVEASFYLPSGRENDILKEPTGFLNLRGEGAEHEKQVDILSQISNVVIVSMDITDLNHDDVIKTMKIVHHNCRKIIMIISNKFQLSKKDQKLHLEYYRNSIGKQPSENVTKIATYTQQKEKNSSQITIEVREAIHKNLMGENGKILKDACQIMSGKMVKIDENSKYCLEGKQLAQKVIYAKPRNASRTELLPLQGEHWKEWSRLLKCKKRTKAAGGGIQRVGTEEKQMNNHRLQQIKLCSNTSPFMLRFVEGLKEVIYSPTLDYYLQWLKIYLDDASREKLPPLQALYHEKRIQLKDLKKTQTVQGRQELEEEIQRIERKIDDVTLGIEHMMREVGQMYEASNLYFGNLPELAAVLLLRGHSLEIMDGDASGVPLSWLKAVFTELEKKLGNEKLFTLSVLGVQSSGKSTLLNTMFGLQFPVSAGRCTRGVYVHLVKVKYNKELPFNYVAVLDTEGLRAQEIGDSKYDHDNELATFIIGLGTVTLINVKGENVAEIKDILQIVAHAFLRMKMVNNDIQKQRSCIFVHQNVPAVDAKEKMKEGEQKFQEALDRMTLEAAKLENISDVLYFNDVIQFDNQKDVWYFPDLWHGNPPMASVNTEYHERVKALRAALLKDFAKDRKGILQFSQQKDFIADMWHGVLADDFVFSFRNSIVTKAYKDLDQKYSELKWELELSMKEWLQSIQWKKDGTQEDLMSQCCNVKKEATTIICTQKEKVVQELKTFIDGNAQVQIMHSWKQEKLIALNYAGDSILVSTKRDIDKISETTAVTILRDREQDTHKEEILQKARQLGEKLKDKLAHDDHILNYEFDKMWNAWINKIHHDKHSKEIPIVHQLEDLLYEEFPHSGPIVRNELRKNPLLQRRFNNGLVGSVTCRDIHDLRPYQTKQSMWARFRYKADSPTAPAMREVKHIFQEVEIYLRTLSQKACDFHIHYAQTVFRSVRKHLHELRYNTDAPFSIPTDVEIRLVAMVASYSHNIFQNMQDHYVKNYSVTAQLEAYKKTTWKMFMNVVRQVADETCVADLISDEIEQEIQKTVMKHLELAILKEIVPHFTTKAKLIKAVLIDLAERENFQDYHSYIKTSKSFTLDWLRKYITRYIFEESAGSYWYMQRATVCIHETIVAIKESIVKLRKYYHQISSPQQWVRRFSGQVSTIITITGKNVSSFTKSKGFDVVNLETMLRKCLDKIEGNTLKCFRQHTMMTVKWPNRPPHEQVLNSIWGCKAMCPFCMEPCMKSDPNHASETDCHQAIQHRPQGVNDGHWVKTDKLNIESCSYTVQTKAGFRCNSVSHTCDEKDTEVFHPYKDYKKYLPKWQIPPSPDMDSSHYWMWYLTRFQHEAAAARNLKLPDIPASWNDITKGRAIESLSMYD